MVLSLRRIARYSVVSLRCFNCSGTQISNLYGHRCFCTSSDLWSGDQRRSRQERWGCQRRRQQMWLSRGSSVPLSRHTNHHTHCGFNCSGSEISCVMSHSFSQPLLQEEVPLLNSMVLNSRVFSNISYIDAKTKKDINVVIASGNGENDISMHDPYNWHCYTRYYFDCFQGEVPFRRKMFVLNARAFSGFSYGDREETDEVKEEAKDDHNDSECENGESQVEGSKSVADPKEVERVCKVVEELFTSDRNMEAVLDQCGVNLSHDLILDVLARFRLAWRPAFRFFSWAGQRPGFFHDSRTYNSMMGILGKTRQFESMVVMLDEMGNKGHLTIETFSIAIRAFAAAREMKKAIGIFELMKKHNFRVGVDTYNCLLDALGRAKLGKEAQALFEKLRDRFTPDLQTYTVLLAGWCKVKKLVEAGKVWNEMIDNGFKPDIVSHNIMLEGLLRGRKRSDAIKLFEIIKAKGPSPNVRSYTILIRDLCKGNRMQEAFDYFDEMLDSGCQPDPAVYTCLLVAFGNQKKMDKVYGLLEEMKEKGCNPDGRTYNALIKLMTNRQMPDDAVRIYKRMIQNGFEPTIHTYNMMMKSYFQMKNYEMGCAVWDEMSRKGCCPDDNSYTVFISGLVRQGRSEEACKYIEEMIEKGMKAPQLDYNKFVADFARAGKPDVLEELAQKMKFSGKFEASNLFARWAEMMKKRVKRTDSSSSSAQSSVFVS